MPAAPEERERDLPGERERGEPVSVGSIEPKWGIQTAEPVSAGSIEPKWGIRQRAGGHVIQKQFRYLQQFRIAFRGAPSTASAGGLQAVCRLRTPRSHTTCAMRNPRGRRVIF